MISPGSLPNGTVGSPDEHAPHEPVEKYRADIDAAERASNARDESELLGCPFCENHAFRHKMDRSEEYWINCASCDANSGVYSSPESAIKAWNTRPAAPSDGEREALAKIETLISGGDRATVNERNAFQHFMALNRTLLDIRDIARTVLRAPVDARASTQPITLEDLGP